ncbi:uncharacterized protein METZ01_LOCUS92902 [marine metagenome]|uniref:Membrane protein 6-pyruvoyl-tetrahydropterin synthase-related domain-containing protein n=1 Tax=marine metagenome TaxID=408172 RepID=A0A381VJT1_9ZZZZ
MIRKILPKYAPVIIYAFLALLFCFTHYKEGFLFLRGDTGYPLAPEIYLKNHMYAWFNTYWTGQPAGQALNFAFPLLPVIYLLNLVLDPSQSQIVLLTGLFFASGFLPYIFFSLAAPENYKSNILGGLFYMLNIPIIAEWYVPNPWFFLAYIGLPLTAIGCYFITKCYWRGILWLIFGYLSITSGFANTPFILITILSNILIVIYFGISKKINYGKQLFVIASLVTTFILISFWWFSLLFDYRQEGEAIIQNLNVSHWAVDSSRNANIFNLLTNSFTPSLAGSSTPYSKLLENTFIVGLYIFLPIIFLAYLLNHFKTPHIAYLLIVYFVIMFLVKGTQSPFGGIYLLMLEHIPYFAIFKTPAEKFGVLFLFWQAFILTITFKKNSHIVVGALIILFLAYPAYTGNLFPDISTNKGIDLKARQKVPQSYKEVAAIINEDEFNGRVLLLPLVWNYQVTYNSINYRGLPFLKTMIKKPLIGNWDIERDNTFLFLKNLQNEPVFSAWAKRFNINWIVLNKDLGSQLTKNPSDGIIDIELMLNSGEGYKKVGEFNNLALYKAKIKENSKDISSEGIIPHIYSPSKINIIKYE